MTQETRLAVHAMIDSFLAQQRLLTDHLNMRPTAATVFLTITQASSAHWAPSLAGPGKGARARTGSISRRGLAAATGYPRETVRRIVIELIGAGLVTDLGHAGVKLRDGALAPRVAGERIQHWAVELARLCDELAALGVPAPIRVPRDRTSLPA